MLAAHLMRLAILFVTCLVACGERDQHRSRRNDGAQVLGNSDTDVSGGGDSDATPPPGDDAPPAGGDTEPVHYVDCASVPALGTWTGTFDGTLRSSVDPNEYPVYGTVSLEITCGPQKIDVAGELSGQGCIDTCWPYTATITGEYDPATSTLTAAMTGTVTAADLFPIPFTGTFLGEYDAQLDALSGTWEGQGELFTATATGAGTWVADR
jgi:hypothetical protein